jgi:hypothetical protein
VERGMLSRRWSPENLGITRGHIASPKVHNAPLHL